MLSLLIGAPVAGRVETMPTLQGARQRARAEITDAIKAEARRQLADAGAAQLSLRSVARELGMVSSALYRYFPSRDELLTALIIDAYDALGAAAEADLATVPREAEPVERWLAVCRAARRWALAHPHEYALLYGSPVPGYAAPKATVGPAARTARALLAVLRDAHADGLLDASAGPLPPAAVRQDARRVLAELQLELPDRVAVAFVTAWSALYGLLSFELFGHFTDVITAREEYFDHAATQLAAVTGLPTTPPAPR